MPIRREVVCVRSLQFLECKNSIGNVSVAIRLQFSSKYVVTASYSGKEIYSLWAGGELFLGPASRVMNMLERR